MRKTEGGTGPGTTQATEISEEKGTERGPPGLPFLAHSTPSPTLRPHCAPLARETSPLPRHLIPLVASRRSCCCLQPQEARNETMSSAHRQPCRGLKAGTLSLKGPSPNLGLPVMTSIPEAATKSFLHPFLLLSSVPRPESDSGQPSAGPQLASSPSWSQHNQSCHPLWPNDL